MDLNVDKNPTNEVDKLSINLLVSRTENDPSRRSFSDLARDEIALFAGLPGNAANKALDHLRNEPKTVIEQAAIGAAFAVPIVCAVRNPAIFGKAASTTIMDVADKAGLIFAGLAGVDWGLRIGVPMYDVASNAKHLSAAKDKLASNVGTGVVEYGAGIAGGLAAAGLAWKLAPQWANVAPKFDAKPSLQLNEKPRSLEVESGTLKTARENVIKDDVVALYEKSFPLEERQPVLEVKDLVEKGRIVVHTTREANGELKGFSFTSLHDETPIKFANLDFIATAENARSQGLGSLHFSRLREIVSKEYPKLQAMTLEMEHPLEAGIDAAVIAQRQYRSKFYDRLDTPDTNIKFNILDFEDPAYRGPAQWRAWVYKPEEFNAVKAARTMYTDEGGYQLPKRAIQVKEFERANNFWEPSFNFPMAGLYAGISSAWVLK